MKSGYALDGNTPLYIKGSNTALTSATLKEALAKGEKIYTENKDGDQDDNHLAVKGEHYAYVTKLYDEDGKEVSAENVAAGKKADGKTDAGKYFTSSAADTGVTNKTTLEVAKVLMQMNLYHLLKAQQSMVLSLSVFMLVLTQPKTIRL